MTTTRHYSPRLGAIADAQFEAVARRMDLGAFVRAEPAGPGLFGQNVFLTTSAGEFVFRGAPHWRHGQPDDAWQFPKEQFYADMLHARTNVPVAWPQRLDDSCSIFQWPYLIMPRLEGVCLADRAARVSVAAQDWPMIARALGRALAGLQSVHVAQAGDYDPATRAIAPFEGGFGGHLAREIARAADGARRNGALTEDDEDWLASVTAAAADPTPPAQAVYTHNDYALGNVLVRRDGAGWRVSGVIDLMTSCFGDAAADLVRLSCHWIDAHPERAAAFINGYRDAGGAPPPDRARIAALVVCERLLIWEYFTRPDLAPAPAPTEESAAAAAASASASAAAAAAQTPANTTEAPMRERLFGRKSFRAWATPYLDALSRMVSS